VSLRSADAGPGHDSRSQGPGSCEEDGKPRLSGAIMRRAGVLEAVGLRDIDTCEDDGQNQAAWSTLLSRAIEICPGAVVKPAR
jgi:hypothetical protein